MTTQAIPRILLNCLTVLYAGLMAVSAVLSPNVTPLWCMIVILVSAGLLVASIWLDWPFLLVGLIGIIVAAVGNGINLYGSLHVSHLMVRLVVSAVLLTLSIWIHRREKRQRMTQTLHTDDATAGKSHSD